jgi:hypothetical protein
MSLLSTMLRSLRELWEESTPTLSPPPTSNPESTAPTTTPSTTTPPATLEAGLLGVVLQTMREMQSENLREIRGMVSDILQGREVDLSQLPPTEESRPSRTSYDPPDYDDPGTEDLPPGIQGIIAREEQETYDVRLLRTEQEVLARQRDEARAMLMDMQGPGSAPS